LKFDGAADDAVRAAVVVRRRTRRVRRRVEPLLDVGQLQLGPQHLRLKLRVTPRTKVAFAYLVGVVVEEVLLD
jgi:hypothetical protein